jgi:hypothetical protein
MRRDRIHTRLTIAFAVAALFAVLVLPGLAAAARDGNGDRIPDRWERKHHLSLKVDQRKRDQDRDGLKNLAEFKHKTDPRDADSDDDGIEDGDDKSPNGDGPGHDVGDDHGNHGPNHT